MNSKAKIIRIQIHRHWKHIRRTRRKQSNETKAFNHFLSFLKKKSPRKQREILRFSSYTWIEAPQDMRFLDNKIETINFINKIEKCLRKNKWVFVDLEEVKDLDYGGITVLLSIMFQFRKNRIKFNGNYPFDSKAKEILKESQFFELLFKRRFFEEHSEFKKGNQIYGRGSKIVESPLGKEIITEASKTIWGSKRRCKGMQRSLVELMHNTHNHADYNKKGEEYWWISVDHDVVNKVVSFGFVDYGQGIFESLNNKSPNSKWVGWFDKMKARLKYGHNAEILQKILEGEFHMTVTGESFRGKGLPGIKEALDRNQISNLHIISNNVHADVSKSNYSLLNKSFSGTFISWQLCYTNQNIV